MLGIIQVVKVLEGTFDACTSHFGRVLYPTGIAVDDNGYVYVANAVKQTYSQIILLMENW